MSKDALKTLARAVGDSGVWTWWTENLPASIQLEFINCQLYFQPPEPGNPPSTQIALRFRNPVSVNFITPKDSEFPKEWPEMFRAEELDYLSIEDRQFTFENGDLMQQILSQARVVDTTVGIPPWDSDFPDATLHFGMLCREGGVIIAAEEVQIFTHEGEIKLKDVQMLHDHWWLYWREYWKKRETDEALPKDWLCESTIPVGDVIDSGGSDDDDSDTGWLKRFFGKGK